MWQDIKTAPRDGTVILIYRPNAFLPILTARFLPDGKLRFTCSEDGVAIRTKPLKKRGTGEAELWMHLPPAPKESE